jgi:hypothetical protein
MKKYSTFLVGMLYCLCAGAAPIPYSSGTYSPQSLEQIRSALYIVGDDASTTLVDGDLTQFDPSFSNAVDGMDARKMSNFSENLGMIRGTTTLVIERRHTIEVSDTIFYKLWNVKQRNYQFQFTTAALDHPGLQGFLEDSYLHTSTPVNLNGITNISFSVNSDTASSAAYRFRIVFITPAATPFTFVSAKAYESNNAITIDWKTENELNIKQYNVEKSTDGKLFNNVTGINPSKLSAANYSWTDLHSTEGNNYYRIQSTNSNGEIAYSPVLSVFKEKYVEGIRVFPNPVTNNTIHLKIENQPAGLYVVRLLNNSGQPVMVKQIQHAGGSITKDINTPGMSKGLYHLEITKPGGTKSSIQVLY